MSSQPVPEESVEALRAAWFAGFSESGEGFNAEYPFEGETLEDDPDLKERADKYVAALHPDQSKGER